MKHILLLFYSISFLLSGCAGQTKPYIPSDIPLLDKNQARIILTRDKQITGAASSIIFIDVGKDIESNAIMYIHDFNIEDIINNENIPSTAGFPVDFMSFNPRLVKPLYCGNMEEGCINYNKKWPRKHIYNVLFGSGNFIFLDEDLNEITPPPKHFIPEMIDIVKTPDNRIIYRNTQVIGSAEVGETLIWDRQPGIMRLGSVWYDGVGFMPKNINVEPGKTYFLHYTTRIGQRWEVKNIK